MDLNKCCTVDIETNGLTRDLLDYSSFPYKLNQEARLWVVSVTNVATGETFSLEKEEITKEALEGILKDYDFVILHNGVKFDLPMLQLFNVIDYTIGYLSAHDSLNGRSVRFIDTLIMSRLLNPDRYEGHSLKAWGKRLDFPKDDYRNQCVDAGYIEKKDPKGAEFFKWNPLMRSYCEQDTRVTVQVFKELVTEFSEYPGWKMPFKMETKLADLAFKRESLGFWFDKDLAIKCVEDLAEKMENLRLLVNPKLPPKPMTKTEISGFVPPKTQLKKDGSPSSHMVRFAEKVGAELVEHDGKYLFKYKGGEAFIPFEGAIETHTVADISNLDHVKQTLINLGWVPTEWAERDFTKDSKKVSLPYEKREIAFRKWLTETMNGKYKELRLEIAFENFKVNTVDELWEAVLHKLPGKFPVRLPTSPKIRVGVEKELCPALEKLGEKVEFAKDFALYLTYKHRKSCIAGGDIEDMDFDDEVPNSGYLSNYREVDGRVPTPSIEIGASTSRYKHIEIANIPRASSIYGKEMRSLFGSGRGAVQFGFDYASLEARIQGHYCYNYTDGAELSETLLAEKPNDIHSVTGRKLGIPRSDAKSINYMLMYGGSWVKAKKMLGLSEKEAKDIVVNFWDSMPALKELKESLEAQWETNDKKFIYAIDGRKLFVRSKHSIINLLFQSGGVICAKYVSVFIMESFEKEGYLIDPFKGKPDVCSMIEYHDEQQLYTSPSFFSFERFDTKKDAEEFVTKWEGAQLSDISEGKTFYVALPNKISQTIEENIEKMGNLLKLNVPLGYAYSVANNWYGCH